MALPWVLWFALWQDSMIGFPWWFIIWDLLLIMIASRRLYFYHFYDEFHYPESEDSHLHHPCPHPTPPYQTNPQMSCNTVPVPGGYGLQTYAPMYTTPYVGNTVSCVPPEGVPVTPSYLTPAVPPNTVSYQPPPFQTQPPRL
eukprot:TRINITY_DN25510_c0_g1_i2.p1 TRINITY_DN25510_c0_g1~~TRINITY_DN25510_c0_g1_i2.p1  ORF type:complete len:142 (-),score=20.09 TRINITY_DN25510_c0_g1_i2:258-683(-)